jgi:hypothetical protein
MVNSVNSLNRSVSGSDLPPFSPQVSQPAAENGGAIPKSPMDSRKRILGTLLKSYFSKSTLFKDPDWDLLTLKELFILYIFYVNSCLSGIESNKWILQGKFISRKYTAEDLNEFPSEVRRHLRLFYDNEAFWDEPIFRILGKEAPESTDCREVFNQLMTYFPLYLDQMTQQIEKAMKGSEDMQMYVDTLFAELNVKIGKFDPQAWVKNIKQIGIAISNISRYFRKLNEKVKVESQKARFYGGDWDPMLRDTAGYKTLFKAKIRDIRKFSLQLPTCRMFPEIAAVLEQGKKVFAKLHEEILFMFEYEVFPFLDLILNLAQKNVKAAPSDSKEDLSWMDDTPVRKRKEPTRTIETIDYSADEALVVVTSAKPTKPEPLYQPKEIEPYLLNLEWECRTKAAQIPCDPATCDKRVLGFRKRCYQNADYHFQMLRQTYSMVEQCVEKGRTELLGGFVPFLSLHQHLALEQILRAQHAEDLLQKKRPYEEVQWSHDLVELAQKSTPHLQALRFANIWQRYPTTYNIPKVAPQALLKETIQTANRLLGISAPSLDAVKIQATTPEPFDYKFPKEFPPLFQAIEKDLEGMIQQSQSEEVRDRLQHAQYHLQNLKHSFALAHLFEKRHDYYGSLEHHLHWSMQFLLEQYSQALLLMHDLGDHKTHDIAELSTLLGTEGFKFVDEDMINPLNIQMAIHYPFYHTHTQGLHLQLSSALSQDFSSPQSKSAVRLERPVFDLVHRFLLQLQGIIKKNKQLSSSSLVIK